MCGINGIIDFKSKIGKNRRHDLIHNMNEKMIYRGPDAEGIYDDDYVSLGMRRLSVIDLTGGMQPIYNEDQTIVVFCNGEIYNFAKLREDLIQKDHTFHTKSDTEVLAHGYEEHGEAIFEKLDGMYAAVIYDTRKKLLLLARDRMGEKPLYYFKNDDYLSFASELNSLRENQLIKYEIDAEALNQFLQLAYIPAPLSIYKNVYKLCPGKVLRIDIGLNQTECKTYWDASSFIRRKENINYKEAVKRLYDLLNRSVKERIVSDVPVGAFLSGGIDSAIIVGLMKRNSEAPINTFTIGFNEKEFDERGRARMVADLNGTIHHEYVMGCNDALEYIDFIMEQAGEPFADPSMLPTYFVSKKAGEHVKVILTGDAGDELFLGYNKYLINYYAKMYKKIPKLLRKQVIERLVKKLPDRNVTSRKINKVINNAYKDIFEQREAMMCLGFKKDEMSELMRDAYQVLSSLDFVRAAYEKNSGCDELSKTQYTDLTIVLEGDMLVKVDRMGMLASIESRTPMLSGDMVEFALQLPSEFKLSGRKTKKILKETFRELLPEHFDKLPKSGFDVPVADWFRNELKEELLTLLNRETIDRQGIFNHGYIEKILEEHFSKAKNRGRELWALYVFQKWYNGHMTDEEKHSVQ